MSTRTELEPTSTECLRALLDERGVEHYDGTESTLWGKDASGYRFSADELTSGRLSVHMWCETPEHAVDATLGRGTCEAMKVPLEWDESWNDMFEGAGHVEIFRWVCSHCGRVLDGGSEYVERDTFCPKCGRQIEWEDDE